MKKELSGEYLAPNVRVVEMKSLQALCLSANVGVKGNPFADNDETEW